MSLAPDNVRAERLKLIHDLRDICEKQKVEIDDAMILRLLDMCQRSLVHLELPQKAAMQVVTGMIEEAANILENAGHKAIVPDMRNVAEFLKDQEATHA